MPIPRYPAPMDTYDPNLRTDAPVSIAYISKDNRIEVIRAAGRQWVATAAGISFVRVSDHPYEGAYRTFIPYSRLLQLEQEAPALAEQESRVRHSGVDHCPMGCLSPNTGEPLSSAHTTPHQDEAFQARIRQHFQESADRSKIDT